MVQRESAQKEKAAQAPSVLARGYRRLGVLPRPRLNTYAEDAGTSWSRTGETGSI